MLKNLFQKKFRKYNFRIIFFEKILSKSFPVFGRKRSHPSEVRRSPNRELTFAADSIVKREYLVWFWNRRLSKLLAGNDIEERLVLGYSRLAEHRSLRLVVHTYQVLWKPHKNTS
ncbi:hypothetical protein DSO57_1005760 [Entomophthora muscae]|uniref:Uncharacterized protein n=1 Tax=Entomophthora muscae TaxID=34485 RepID=A0ACC2U646_9FUNG|nr:hypothetical protein DSO57_1005760 [Entomophthora muscae]